MSSAFDITSHLSEVVEATLKDGPQVVTKDGVETAVLVSIEDWKRLKPEAGSTSIQPQRSLKEILLNLNGPHDLYIPPRGQFRLREPVEFE